MDCLWIMVTIYTKQTFPAPSRYQNVCDYCLQWICASWVQSCLLVMIRGVVCFFSSTPMLNKSLPFITSCMLQTYPMVPGVWFFFFLLNSNEIESRIRSWSGASKLTSTKDCTRTCNYQLMLVLSIHLVPVSLVDCRRVSLVDSIVALLNCSRNFQNSEYNLYYWLVGFESQLKSN